MYLPNLYSESTASNEREEMNKTTLIVILESKKFMVPTTGSTSAPDGLTPNQALRTIYSLVSLIVVTW
jgi:hypothetical protein